MINKSKLSSNKISEEELNQELSTDDLKDVAGGFSGLTDYTTIGEQAIKKKPKKDSINKK